MTKRPRIGALTACFVMVLGTTLAAGAQSTAPCEQDARHRGLDFWVGDWQVVDGDGQAVGTNRVEKSQSGCLIEEHWTSARGGSGQSMNYFDPSDGLWKQNWVDQGGGVVQYEGEVEDGVLHYRGRHIRRDGTVTMARVVLEPIGEGRLHHLIEHSSDDGMTWSTYFDGTYIPAGEKVVVREAPKETVVPKETAAPVGEVVAAPQTASPPAVSELPVIEPAQPQAARQAVQEGSDVKAVTRELQREEIPETQAPELVMASPMILEVKPGNIAQYPENTAWRTDETAGFICNEVTLRQVGVGHKSKRGMVHLVIASKLFTHRRQKKVELLVELIDNGRVVASEDLGKIRLGLNIPSHGEDGLLALAELELTLEQFEALFDGEAEPILRFTLICPSGR